MATESGAHETPTGPAGGGNPDRTSHVVEVLSSAFGDLVTTNPEAFRRKFRAMAGDPYAFYRGSACLFYADVADQDDPWADDRTGRVWIQGDLHAGNFGTYMDGSGVLIFDVNDYDEAYLGHFTWDLKRMAASIGLLGWTRALGDEEIADLIETYVRAYVDQVRHFVGSDRDHEWSLRLDTATGAVREALLDAQLCTRIGMLEQRTVVEDYQRRFRRSSTVRPLEGEEREAVERAYQEYLSTIPDSKRMGSITYALKDAVAVTGFGVGSAGMPSYQLLVEGHTQALENDVVLSMKQASIAAPARVAPDDAAEEFFEHHGHRTAVSQRTLQAHSDPWLGWARMVGGLHDGGGFVVKEESPYEADLAWAELTEHDEMAEVLEQLGRATAKVHCVSDVDATDVPLVEGQAEDAIAGVVEGREEELVADLVRFGLEYAHQVRSDHAAFVDAYRSGSIPGLEPARA